MLKETEIEETVDFLSLVAFQLGGPGPPAPPPPGYAYAICIDSCASRKYSVFLSTVFVNCSYRVQRYLDGKCELSKAAKFFVKVRNTS